MGFIKGVGYLLVTAGVLFVALPWLYRWLNEKYGDGAGAAFMWALWIAVCLIGMSVGTEQYPSWMY